MWQAPRASIAESLDQQLLTRTEPPSHANAKALLKRHKIACDEVKSVDVDAILFIDSDKRPFTAWLRASQYGQISVWVEKGFAAERGEEED